MAGHWLAYSVQAWRRRLQLMTPYSLPPRAPLATSRTKQDQRAYLAPATDLRRATSGGSLANVELQGAALNYLQHQPTTRYVRLGELGHGGTAIALRMTSENASV